MSEDKTYILKPKVKFTNGVNVKGYNKQFEIDGKQGTITLEAFNELFVEFSVDATREQIAEAVFESDSKLSKPLFVGGREGSTRWVDEDGLNKFVDRIVTLITQGEKE